MLVERLSKRMSGALFGRDVVLVARKSSCILALDTLKSTAASKGSPVAPSFLQRPEPLCLGNGDVDDKQRRQPPTPYMRARYRESRVMMMMQRPRKDSSSANKLTVKYACYPRRVFRNTFEPTATCCELPARCRTLSPSSSVGSPPASPLLSSAREAYYPESRSPDRSIRNVRTGHRPPVREPNSCGRAIGRHPSGVWLWAATLRVRRLLTIGEVSDKSPDASRDSST